MLRVLRSMFNMTRADFLDGESLGQFDATQIGQAANIFLRHQLFDQLLNAVGYPTNPSRVNFSRLNIIKSLPAHVQAVSFTSQSLK
jgi:hypothetical protein